MLGSLKFWALIAAGAMVAGCSTDKTKFDGAALLEQRCSGCHSTSIPKNARKTERQWQETVERMIGKGVELSPDEKKQLIDYLSRVYRP